MKIYDSAIPSLKAAAVGAVLTLTPVSQGSVTAPKAVTPSNAHMVVSAAVPGIGLDLTRLYYGGPQGYAALSVTLAGVVAGDTLTVDGVVYTAGTDFVVGTMPVTATNLAAAINAHYALQPGPWFNINAEGVLFQAVLSGTGTGTLAGDVDVEASLDGITPYSLGAAGAPLFSLTDAKPTDATPDAKPAFQFVRANPKTLTGTGAHLVVLMGLTNIH